jgi:hypothetical protein
MMLVRLVTFAATSRSSIAHKLEEIVCECYQVVKDEFDRLLGTIHPALR